MSTTSATSGLPTESRAASAGSGTRVDFPETRRSVGPTSVGPLYVATCGVMLVGAVAFGGAVFAAADFAAAGFAAVAFASAGASSGSAPNAAQESSAAHAATMAIRKGARARSIVAFMLVLRLVSSGVGFRRQVLDRLPRAADDLELLLRLDRLRGRGRRAPHDDHDLLRLGLRGRVAVGVAVGRAHGGAQQVPAARPGGGDGLDVR